MGNRQSSASTALGHQQQQPNTPRPGGNERRRNKLFLNAISIQSIGKALSFKKKRPTDAVQMHQPKEDPETPTPVTAAPSAMTSVPSFSPLAFSEMPKTYEVDFTDAGFLGSGHYASVYRGKNRSTGQAIAVKKVNKKLTRVESLKLEVEALRKMAGHPNIVELYDVYLDDDHMYLVLELLAGGELFDRIVSSGAYSERDAAFHMRKIGSALQYMHSKGIVHRDLKPENLVLVDNTPESAIKISDFGLSKILKDDEEVMMTICGTKAYSAPEVGFGYRQAGVPRNDSGYSAKVDMWSLGVILYVIVAAYHPFDPHGVDDDRTIWSRIVACKWDFNDQVWETLSDSLKDLLRKLIEPDPDKRLSADEFLQHPWLSDVSSPVCPLPSLTRTRSSRYWRNVQQEAAAATVRAVHKPATLVESGESSSDPSQRVADSNTSSVEQTPPVPKAGSDASALKDPTIVDDDHNIV